MYYNETIYVNINTAYVSPSCHAGARVGLRGFATWPGVPRRIHVACANINPLFDVF